MYKVVKKVDAIVRKIADNKTAYNYITKDFSPTISLAVIEGINYNAPITADQTWTYFILDGEMKII